jgi:selT/selW/selH-like putative selenoprotein
LAEALQKRYGARAELIKSGGGVFEVVRNDKLIFSKKATGRFPEHEEIFDIMDRAQ